jgi:glutathione S-transferase
MPLALVIGNKNYSSWSMRPWVLMREAGIAFEEIQLWFDEDGHPENIERYSPAGRVPVLLVDNEPVWDSLTVCETIAEMFPQKRLWPSDASARALARSICAEMHSGFRDLRGAMPVNICTPLPGKGMNPAVRKDIDRIVAIWHSCRERFGAAGPMLFGEFCIADAYFAPVVTRFMTYAVPLPPVAEAYAAAVFRLAAMQEWMAAARLETAFVAADEPYAEAGNPSTRS